MVQKIAQTVAMRYQRHGGMPCVDAYAVSNVKPYLKIHMVDSTEDSLVELLILRKSVAHDGTIRYYNKDNQLHRIHGPAVIKANGSKIWCRNGVRHREDGPAVEWVNGMQEWYQDGTIHRISAPAVIHVDGYTEWWEHGQVIKPN